MTAARSDLMQTSGGKFAPADRRTVIARAVLAVLQNPTGIETLDWQIADAVLAASQPDREALASAICDGMSRGNIQWVDAGPTLRADCLATADYIIDSLLSGAGSGADTKSDGGCNCSWGCVEADNCRRKLGPLPDWKQDQSETSRIKPRPSDPSPGPDVSATKEAQLCERRKGEPPAIFSKHEERNGTTPTAVSPDVREALEESSQTLEYLRREARAWGKIFSVNVDHVLDKNRKALSALTRPLGGFVQGSIATKRSSDPEGSSRTETAIATMLCKSGKFETGEGTCAFVCMGRLGDVRKDGCSHAKRVHAKLAATIAEGLRAECGYDHGYADGVEWATCHAAVAETNAAASGNTSLVSGASAEPNHQPHAVSQGWRTDLENAPSPSDLELCDCLLLIQSVSGEVLHATGKIGSAYRASVAPYQFEPHECSAWRVVPAPPSPAKTGGAS